MPKETHRPSNFVTNYLQNLLDAESNNQPINYMENIMALEEGRVTEENVHDIARTIIETGLHRSAGRYGRFLNWYYDNYKNNSDA
jgi:hypothetical protein